MVRPEKTEAIEALKGKLSAAKGIVLADFTGITVSEANDLRRKCRDAEVEYRVVKNTIARLAVKEADIGELEEHTDRSLRAGSTRCSHPTPCR